MISKLLLVLKIYKYQKTRMLFNIISFIIVMFSLNFIICTIYSITETKNLVKESEESKVFWMDFYDGPSFQKESQAGMGEERFNQLELELFEQSYAEYEMIPVYSNDTNFLRYSVLSNIKRIQDSGLKIYMVDPAYFTFFHIPLVQGRVYAADDVKQNNLLVINKHFYDKVKGYIDENILQMGEEHYRIIGVVDDDNKGYHFSVRGMRKQYETLYVTPPSGLYRREMTGFLVKRPGESSSSFVMKQMGEYTAELNRKTVQIKPFTEGVSEVINEISYGAVILFVFSLVLLICAELGLFGTLQLFNKERSRDFCIKMVYGCTYRDIVFEVLFEFLWISFVGTILGVILSNGLMYEVNTILNPPVTILNNLWINVVLILFVNGLSLALAIYPAYSAAKNRPVEILRQL